MTTSLKHKECNLQGLDLVNPIDANLFKKNKRINNHIYVFVSATLNTMLGINVAKIGDAINPWTRVFQGWGKKYGGLFPDLELLKTFPAVWWNPENPWEAIMIRDHALHVYLKKHLYYALIDKVGAYRLNEIFGDVPVSREFFIFDYFTNDEIITIIEQAMEFIREDIKNPNSEYKAYHTIIDANKRELIKASARAQYERNKDYGLRDFQYHSAYKNVEYSIKNKCKGLLNCTLFVAPTRAGKTHTALTELRLLIEKEKLSESLTLVISGIVPALEEWVESCESHVDFKNLTILKMNDIKDNPNIIEENRDKGNNHIIVVASLQDMAGSNRNNGVKYNHFFLTEEKLTKVFVDEAHYAMLSMSPEYSKVLRNNDYFEEEELTGIKKKDQKKLAKNLGALNPEYGVGYITATPFDALYSGGFNINEDNVTIITAQDIQEEHKKWCEENNKDESESPYYGIPKPYSFRAPVDMPWDILFDTYPDGSLMYRDNIKNIISDLFGVTHSGASANMLNNDLFKEEHLGNGILWTVATRKIADQIEDIMHEVLTEDEYAIFNISSARGSKWSHLESGQVKNILDQVKTKFIVITVNKMMTGATLEKVDTVVFARTISSANALIQYVGRAGSPYVITTELEEIDETTGEKKKVKVCMKPYCAAIFFDPELMLSIHEQKLSYMVNHSADKYKDADKGAYEAINDELLEINPIVDYDPVLGQLREMNTNDVVKMMMEVNQHNRDPFRNSLKTIDAFNIKNISSDSILRLDKISFRSARKKSLDFPYEDKDSIDPDSPAGECKYVGCGKPVFKSDMCKDHCESHERTVSESLKRVSEGNADKGNAVDNYFMDIFDRMNDLTVLCMIYVVVHPDDVFSMREILLSSQSGVGARISKNIGLDVELLEMLVSDDAFKPSIDLMLRKQEAIYAEMDGDTKIVDIMKSLKNLSANEIISSDLAVRLLNDNVDVNGLVKCPVVMDNGCKSGVILIDLAERLRDHGFSDEVIGESLWCIPTSGIAYEILLLVYESKGWNVDHILWAGGDYSALEVNDFLVRYQCGKIDENSDKDMFMLGLFDDVLKDLQDERIDVNKVDNTKNVTIGDSDTCENVVKLFDYVISNPPYQIITSVSDTGRAHARGIYDHFQKVAYDLANNTVMIYPAGWQNSLDKGFGKWILDHNVKTIDNVAGHEVFGPAIRKDYPICVVSVIEGYNGNLVINGFDNERDSKVWVDTQIKYDLLEKTKEFDKLSIKSTNISEIKNVADYPQYGISKDNSDMEDPIKIYVKAKSGAQADGSDYFIERSKALEAMSEEYIDKYVVSIQNSYFIQSRTKIELLNDPRLRFNVKTFGKDYVYGTTWQALKTFDSQEEADNLCKYLNTRIVSMLIAYSMHRSNFCPLVPDLKDYTNNNPNIDWEEKDKSIEEQLYALWGINEEQIMAINS